MSKDKTTISSETYRSNYRVFSKLIIITPIFTVGLINWLMTIALIFSKIKLGEYLYLIMKIKMT